MAKPELVFTYDSSHDAAYMQAVQREGAVVLRGFLDDDTLDLVTEEIDRGKFRLINDVHGGVHEQYGLQEWQVPDAPRFTRDVAERAGELVRGQGIPWLPTAIRAQRYEPGTSGVDWHRDFASSQLVVGIGNVYGEARLDLEIAGEELPIDLIPGDWVFIRNSGLNPGVDDRMRHRVHAPIDEPRLSLGVRME